MTWIIARLWPLWEKATGRRYFASCDIASWPPMVCGGVTQYGEHTCSVILVGYIRRDGVIVVQDQWTL